MTRAALFTFTLFAAHAWATPGQLFVEPDAGTASFQPQVFGPYAPKSPTPEQQEGIDFAFITGPAAVHRLELTTETTFGTRGAGTERLEVAFAWRLGNTQLALIGRTGVGIALANERWLQVQGYFASLGARMISTPGRFVLEAGLRVLPGFGTLTASNPNAQTLAFEATLSSMAADDTRWLSFENWGLQAYADLMARTQPVGCLSTTFGLRTGGQSSLMPVRVNTWLGVEDHFVANAFFELFVAASRLHGVLGARGDLSLSSLWPADQPLPAVVNLYVGWAPLHWLSIRLFGGVGLSPMATERMQGQAGVRFQLSFF
ncbi:MAG: hypothetical protein JNK82_22105 [Myxococcaceae bacterium]|nr:hypothetical protein [Myxococcaceae bacterium]